MLLQHRWDMIMMEFSSSGAKTFPQEVPRQDRWTGQKKRGCSQVGSKAGGGPLERCRREVLAGTGLVGRLLHPANICGSQPGHRDNRHGNTKTKVEALELWCSDQQWLLGRVDGAASFLQL